MSRLCGLLVFGIGFGWAQEAGVTVIERPADARTPTANQRRLRPDARPADDPDLTRLIETSPGVQVRRRGDVGAPATVTIRGAGGHQLRVFLDGVPLDLARGGAVDLSLLPAGAVESLTVLRGAQGAAYGSGAQGGVLRVALRAVPESVVGMRAGSFGLTQAEAVGGTDGLVAGVQLARARGDFEFTDVNGRSRVRQNQDHRRLGGFVRQQIGRVRLLALGQSMVRGEPGLEQFEGDGRSVNQLGLLGASWQSGQWSFAGWTQQQRYRFRQTSQVLAGQVERAELADGNTGGRIAWNRRWAVWGLGASGLVQREATADFARHRGALTLTGDWRRRMVASTRLDMTDQRTPVLAPQLGIRWPIGHWTLQANVGRLFRDPSIDELFVQSAGIRGNQNLRLEDGWGADASVHWRRDGLRLELTAFGQRYDRLILFVPISAWLIEAQDRFAADAVGFEAALDWRWRRMRLRLTHLEQQVRFRDGPVLPFRPDRLTRLHAQLKMSGGLQLFGNCRRPSTVTTDVFGQRTLPSYVWIDAGAAWSRGAWRISAQLRNLTAVQALDALQQPQPGRAWLLGVRWRP